MSTGIQGLAEHTAAATPSALETIPAVQRWLPGGSSFTLGAKSKIVYFDAALADTARRFSTNMSSATGHAVVAVAGGTSAPGDIELRVGAVAGSAPSSDAYSVTVGEKLILVGATLDGARYGTSTAEQLLRRSPTIPGGTAVDWPAYRERGPMLDVGRKYLSIPWIRAQIRRMAYLKMNYLHLHLSDEFGFRLESSAHPEIVASQHYSKQEIRDLVTYATSYGVQVVPEIDMPGHMHTALAAHPELQLRNARDEAAAGALDLSNPRSYDLMRDLLDEFIPVFPSRFWHIGADEFLPYLTDYNDYPQLGAYARAHYGPEAQPRDALFGFVNWADEIVRSHGKTTRMWNDGYVRGDSTVGVNPRHSRRALVGWRGHPVLRKCLQRSRTDRTRPRGPECRRRADLLHDRADRLGHQRTARPRVPALGSVDICRGRSTVARRRRTESRIATPPLVQRSERARGSTCHRYHRTAVGHGTEDLGLHRTGDLSRVPLLSKAIRQSDRTGVSMRFACLKWNVTAAVAAVVLIGTGSPATAESSSTFQHYVALGDSYASVGDFTHLAQPIGCARSTQNYPTQLATRLGIRDFTDASCGDAQTVNMTAPQSIALGTNNPQFDSITPATDLVTISIGGNDLGVGDIAKNCVPLGILDPNGNPCERMYSAADLTGRLTAVSAHVGAVLDGITARAPRATVAYVPYLAILPASGRCPTTPLTARDIEWLGRRQTEMNDTLTAVAHEHGAVVIDISESKGHDMCTPPEVRWVEPLVPAAVTTPFHPNIRGQAYVARMIAAAIG